MTGTKAPERVRAVAAADFPAERMIGLETRVGTGDDFHDAFDLAERALGETVPQGALLAYLLARFGPPNSPSDPYKDLASYVLTTTHPDMLLRITPYAGGDVSIGFSFMTGMALHVACRDWETRSRDAHVRAFHDWIEAEGRVPDWAEETAQAMADKGWPVQPGSSGWRRMMPGIAMIAYLGAKEGDPEDKVSAIRWHREVSDNYEALHPAPGVDWRTDDVASWDEADPLKALALAMGETLRDLERPVWIRDVAIGIRGPFPDGDAPDLPEAPRAASAGIPVGRLLNPDPGPFQRLMAAVGRLDEDQTEAMLRAAALLEGAERRDDAGDGHPPGGMEGSEPHDADPA